MRKLILLAGLALAGCSTGIVPTEQGKYMISGNSAGGAFGNPQSVRADQFSEANAFCAKQGMAVHETGGTTRNGIPFVRPAGASLEFECVPRIPPAAPAASAP